MELNSDRLDPMESATDVSGSTSVDHATTEVAEA